MNETGEIKKKYVKVNLKFDEFFKKRVLPRVRCRKKVSVQYKFDLVPLVSLDHKLFCIEKYVCYDNAREYFASTLCFL